MRIAFMIPCHKLPEQINHLTGTLKRIDGADIYIHVDAKSEAMRRWIAADERIRLVPAEESVDVTWGGYSQCAATIKLLETVLHSGKKYDRVVLMSGQDYPIRDMAGTEAFFREHPDTVFMEFVPLDAPNYRAFEIRNRLYYPHFLQGRSFWTLVIKKAYVTAASALRLHRKGIFDKTYFGSSWWSVPMDCAEGMYRYIADHPAVEKFYQGAICPDESMFQTVFKQLYPDRETGGKIVYADWSENNNGPKVLTKKDVEELLSAHRPEVFARKLDESAVPGILDFVDEALRRNSERGK